MQIFRHSHDISAYLEARGHACRPIARAPDGSAVVAVRAGGRRQPAVFISAGSHATEQAGVTAAVALVERLETDHEVWVVPTRDPMGMNGYRHVLRHALGEEVALEGRHRLPDLLRQRAEVLVDAGDLVVGIVDEIGFSTKNLLGRLGADHRQALEPLWGRRIFIPAGDRGVAGAAPLERAYTLVVAPDGQVLHLNRFHDTPWAPAEVRATRRLLARVRPGICFDLHESTGIEDRYWLSARHQTRPDLDALEARIATQVIERVAATGVQLPDDDYLPHAFFTRSQPGVFWLDAGVRGEGLNLMDYAAREYGLAFGTEMGMYGAFEARVRLGMLTVQTAVAAWAEAA